jgi:uncharacterized lipoprotein YajG
MQAETFDTSVSDGISPEVEKLNYAVQAVRIDFGTLNARNQLIKTTVNPLLDMIMDPLKQDRALRGGTDSKQRYTVSIVVTAERDIDTVQ